MKSVLLTGATGFVGRQAIQFLLARDFVVHAVSSQSHPRSETENLIWHQTDLLDYAETAKLIEKIRPTHLLHFAWYVEHGKLWTARENFLWVGASLNLLQKFIDNGGERAVCAGTCAEYSWTENIYHEVESPLEPQTIYGKCKHAWQIIFESLAEQSGISAAWGRVFFLYGTHEQSSRLVASVIRALLRGEPALCSHGNQIRDFLYTKDAAAAFAALLDSDVRGSLNVASGIPLKLGEIIYRTADLIGKPELIKLNALTAPAHEPPQIVADVTRLREEVGWQPQWTLERGLTETIQWWRENI